MGKLKMLTGNSFPHDVCWSFLFLLFGRRFIIGHETDGYV